jgi:hypothetical protein
MGGVNSDQESLMWWLLKALTGAAVGVAIPLALVVWAGSESEEDKKRRLRKEREEAEQAAARRRNIARIWH